MKGLNTLILALVLIIGSGGSRPPSASGKKGARLFVSHYENVLGTSLEFKVLAQIVAAEKYVISHHLGGVISQSFSATEQTFASKQSLLDLRGAYIDAARSGVTVLAASGDSGAADVKFNEVTYYLHPVTSWPDSDPLVTGVGGIRLHLSAAGNNLKRPTVWNDTYNVQANEFVNGNAGPNPLAGGGGKSVIFTRPGYQNGVRDIVGDSRGVPDISMSAACNGAADMYQSFAGQPARHPDAPAPARRRRSSPGSWPWRTRWPAILPRRDQPVPVPALGPARSRHRGRRDRQQHRLVPAGGQARRCPGSMPGPATTSHPGSAR